jgi:rhodanese-related sulfurtransferase
MKATLRLFVLLAITALCIPFSLQAREPSLEQLKQNVRNMHRSVMDGQPAVSAKNFKKIITSDNEFILLDVRSEAEFNAAHLPGALHVERGRIEWIIPNIIKQTDRTIYVYCQDGKRSGFATERLLEMGYANTSHIADGFEGWVNAGYLVYNMHGEFILSPGGYNKREPRIGNIGK